MSRRWFLTLASAIMVLCVQVSFATLIETDEVVSERGPETRMWENVYEEPILDADGQPTGETEERRSRYIELATGLCYDARPWEEIAAGGEPVWQPTVCEWTASGSLGFSYELMTGPLRVRLSDDLSGSGHVQVQADAEVLNLGVLGLAVYDTATGQFEITETPRSVQPVIDGNRVIYPGAFSCGDIEYVYERGGFHQNLIIRQREALPILSSLGMNESSTLIGIASNIDLDTYAHTAGLRPLDGTPQEVSLILASEEAEVSLSEPLTFANVSGEAVLSFEMGTAWEGALESGDTAEVLTCQLVHSGSDLIFDGVSFDWVAETSSPVTIDYTITVEDEQDVDHRVFVRGVTYHISGIYTVTDGQTLAIEPGAIVKVAASSYIEIEDGGQIIARGEPADWVVFTSASNTGVGDTISGASGNGSRAVWFMNVDNDSRTRESIFEWCKFDRMGSIIGVWGDLYLNNPIRDCIFHVTVNNAMSVTSTDESHTFEFINCLFYAETPGDQTDGRWAVICNTDSDDYDLSFVNCTFAGFGDEINGAAVMVQSANYGDGNSFDLNIDNCLFTQCRYALLDARALPGVPMSGTLNEENCYYWELSEGATNTDGYFDDDDISMTALQNTPYSTRDLNGNFYIAERASNGSVTLVNGNLSSGNDLAENLSLDELSVAAPWEITGNISAAMSHSAYIADSWYVEVGFHYPAVDYALDSGTHEITTNVTIGAGTILTYASNASILVDDYDSTPRALSVSGTADDDGQVRCYPVAATGDMIDDVTDTSYYSAFFIGEDADPDSHVNHAWIRGASKGIYVVSARPHHPIESSHFIDCQDGVWRLSTDPDAQSGDITASLDIRNNLFQRCDEAIVLRVEDDYAGDGHTAFLRVEGNTIAQGATAMLYSARTGGASFHRTINLVFEDNLITQMERGWNANLAGVNPSYFTLNTVDRNNAYWMNGEDVVADCLWDGEILPVSTSRRNTRATPMPVHATNLSSARSDVVTTQGLFGDDGFFLAQANGEASRFPLVLPEDFTLLATGGITIDSGFSGNDYTIWDL
jgi:hypothetical protein